jgi:hypothetical protein
MDLSDTLDAIADVCQDVVDDSRRWRPGFENAGAAVSVEPIAFERRAFGGNRYTLEAELFLVVNASDQRSRQVRAHEVALQLQQELDSAGWSSVASIESLAVREVRFVRASAEAAGGAVLTLDVEVIWT